MNKSIKKLVESQPKGYIQTVADRLDVTRKTVYYAIERELMDHKVIIEMIKLAEEHKATITEIKERIEKIAS